MIPAVALVFALAVANPCLSSTTAASLYEAALRFEGVAEIRLEKLAAERRAHDRTKAELALAIDAASKAPRVVAIERPPWWVPFAIVVGVATGGFAGFVAGGGLAR